MSNPSYVKFAQTQRGSIQASFSVISLSFGILAWIVNFMNTEFHTLQDYSAISSIQSAGTLIINQLDETGSQVDVSQQLNSIKELVGASPSLCMVYFENNTAVTFSSSSCEEQVTDVLTEAVQNAGFGATVVSFRSARPEDFSLNQITGPSSSTSRNFAYTNDNIDRALRGENPVCYSAGRRLICDAGDGTSPQATQEFSPADAGSTLAS